MNIKGLNKAAISRMAKERGHSLHKSTLTNIEELLTSPTLDKLNALSRVFEIEPAFLLWEKGFDMDGQPIGVGDSVPLSTVMWSVKKVALGCSNLQIDDLEFQSLATAAVLNAATKGGYDAGQDEWEKQLTDYQRLPA